MPDDLKTVDWEQEGAAPVTTRAEAPQREKERPRQDERGRAGENGGGDGESGRKRGRFPWMRVILILVVIVLVIAGTAYWFATKDLESTDDAYTDGRAVMIAPQVSGDVIKLAVNDNRFVHKGDLLVKIDPRTFIAARDQAQGQLDLARAQLNAARYGHEVAKVTFPAKLEAAKAQVESANAELQKAQQDYNRQHSVSHSATTQAAIDASTAALAQARAQVAVAQAQERQAEPVQPNIEQTGAQVSQLQAQVEQAQAALDKAKLDLSYTDVVAPQDGWVTKRAVEQGNYVQAGTQIMAIVSPEVWITANFKETQLTRMHPGQQVTIGVDAYPGLTLKGHVDSVQLGTGAKFSAFPPENATGNYVKIVQRVPVKILIDSGLNPNLPLPLGLSVEPTVNLDSGNSREPLLPAERPTGNDPASLHRG